MKRDKVINYSSKTATNDTILNTIVNNSDADKNLLAGEIAVVMTSDNEALYTLNHNKTALIEYKPYYKIKAYIDEQTAGVMKNEEVTITFLHLMLEIYLLMQKLLLHLKMKVLNL